MNKTNIKLSLWREGGLVADDFLFDEIKGVARDMDADTLCISFDDNNYINIDIANFEGNLTFKFIEGMLFGQMI
jgi:hypothetical protein